MMKKMLFGLLLIAAVFAQGMNFTGFNNYKLSTAPGTGVNPPTGNISIWWTVTDSALTMHWRDSSGADHTFSSGGGGLSDAPSDGKQYCRKDAAWVEVVSGGGSDTVTALGTSGTQTINRNTSDKWTLTPSGAVTLATSNFSDMQEAILDITNGYGLISFPESWQWATGLPVLQTAGVNRIRLSSFTLSSAIAIKAESLWSAQAIYGNDAYTQLMLHLNNNATDSSQNNLTPTATNITYDNASGESKWGYSAVFNGSSSKIAYPNNAGFNVGSGDFTLSMWVKFTNVSGYNGFFSTGWQTGAKGMFAYHTGSTLSFNYTVDGSTSKSGTFSWTPSTGVWYRMVFVRSGSNFKVYVNEAQIGSTYNIGSDSIYYVAGNSFMVGTDDAGEFLNGKLDEVKFDKGIARTITTQTSEFHP